MRKLSFILILLLTVSCVDKIAPVTSSIHGLVKDAETSQPLSGCAITLVPTGATTITGNDGAFHFEDVAPETYSVEVSNYGYYANKKSVVVTAGNSMSVDIPLTKYDPNNRLPTLGAMTISEVTHNSVRASSEVIDQGSTSVSERGFLYSEQPNPTIGNAIKKVVQSGMGQFSVTIVSLKEKTQYYIVPYAINSRGTAYGDEVRFTSGDASIIVAPKNVIYVSVSGSDSNDGSSWGKAKKTIAEAIRIAVDGKQIWVSVGSFNEVLTPKDGVNIYGGFSGFETSIDSRTKKTNISKINCSKYTRQTLIDGFAIENENFDTSNFSPIELSDNVTIRNCSFTNNSFRNNFMKISGENIKIDNNNFDGNGGQIIIWITYGKNVRISNCYFRGNFGEALRCCRDVDIYNCVITNNYSGVEVVEYDCIVKMYNCTIAGNYDYGLSLGNEYDRSKPQLELYNCILWNNITIEESNLKIKFFNTEINETNTNPASFKKPILETEWKYDSSISNMVPPTGWKTADWSLSAGSIYINKGLNIYYPIADYPNDISGNSRIANGIIDLGAYEY